MLDPYRAIPLDHLLNVAGPGMLNRMPSARVLEKERPHRFGLMIEVSKAPRILADSSVISSVIGTTRSYGEGMETSSTFIFLSLTDESRCDRELIAYNYM